jgi:hypothetical protein
VETRASEHDLEEDPTGADGDPSGSDQDTNRIAKFFSPKTSMRLPSVFRPLPRSQRSSCR